MNPTELKTLADTLNGIADGKPWQIRHDTATDWREAECQDPLHYIGIGTWHIRLKPWELGRTVNGHTLPEGASWHRQDFPEEMLPAPYRPLIRGEIDMPVDEIDRNDGKGFVQLSGVNDYHCASENYTCHTRTTRPIPPVDAKERKCQHCEYAGPPVWQNGQWSCQNCFHSMEQPTTTLRLLTPEQIAIAYKPDPYGKFRQALADGKTIEYQATVGGQWYPFDSKTKVGFIAPPEAYRIKPEPQWLPLGSDDVPPGSVFRQSETTASCTWYSVLCIHDLGVCFHAGGKDAFTLTYAELERLPWQINRPRHRDADGNPTLWEPCRKPSAV